MADLRPPFEAPPERVISPPREDLDNLRTPLEPGERLVFELFDRTLPSAWEIYLQPHLNGLRPDIVLLNPAVGIAVFEIKDWDLGACDWRIEEKGGGRPALVGRDANGRRFVKPNPFERLRQYRSEIADLYCPMLDRRAGLAAVTAGLVFPFADDDELVERFGPGLAHSAPDGAAERYLTLAGARAVREGDLDTVFPDHARASSQFMGPKVAADLRHWLVEPDVAAEQRRPPRLSREQQVFVAGRTDSGFRRLRGPAGSGKTMVVAGRASTLAAEGKDVLVVSFNITLLNYLRDCAGRFGNELNSVTWLHFHAWCKRLLYGAGRGEDWRSLPWGDPEVDERLASVTMAAIETEPDLIDRYDAILVDEGQDFLPSWWSALRGVLRPEGEMLLVADRAQDVYGRNDLWTERAMEGAGFRGNWATLDVSYRMPRRLVELTADFVSRYLHDQEITAPVPAPQQELDVDHVDLRWVQTSPDRLVEVSVEAIRTSVARTNGGQPAAFADLVFLCDRMELGRRVSARLEEVGVRVLHTFSPNDEYRRQQKLYFFKGDARVKATTIHSFKGWEGRHLVVAAGAADGRKALNAVYTALTRLKSHPDGSRLTVVSAAPELEVFGRSWPEFELAV